jgi:type II secretory pathway pseudopilin PulG
MIGFSKSRTSATPRRDCPWNAGKASGRLIQGLTLVEVVGVLAVLGTLGAIVMPVVQQQIRQAEQQAEAKTMATIGRALEKTILESRTLPGTNDWVDWVAPEVDQPFDRLVNTPGGTPRRLIYHPASALIPGGVGRTQTAAGFQNITPGFDRILVVSLLHRDFPQDLNLGSSNVFEALWNSAPHQAPAGWAASDLPDPDDLTIVRLDLGQLLHQVIINNISENNAAAFISVEENATVLAVPRGTPAQPWQRSFIHGTGLNLHGFLGGIESRELINQDRTLYWTGTGWGTIGGPPGSPWSNAVITAVTDFLNASFPDAKNEQRPRAAIDELYRALWTYMDWAEAGFLEGGNNKKQAPDIYVLRSTVARLNQGTLNLIGSGGGG